MICPTCDGTGEVATSHRFTCYTCHGAKEIPEGPVYDAAVKAEQELARNLARSVSTSEYRAMGG